MYNAYTLKYEGAWGDREEQIYSLLSIQEADYVIALTSKGIFSFEAEIVASKLFDSLESQNSQNEAFDGLTVNVGVVIPPTANISKSEIWLCSHTESKLFILNPYKLNILTAVKYTAKELATLKVGSGSRPTTATISVHEMSSMLTNIKDLQVVEVDHRMKLVVADNWMLLLWDVEKRELERVFDGKEYCEAHREELSGECHAL